MSGLYLLALVGIWLFVGRLTYSTWRRWNPENTNRRIVHIVIGVLLFSIWFGGAFWQVAGKKMYWDAKIKEFCAIDGGVKVYETVELPAEMFNRWNQPNFYDPTQGESALGPEYIFVTERTYYRKDNPVISKYICRIIRRSDKKLLGESISYGRGGGDLFGPWHSSSYHCPSERGEVPLLSKIFKPIRGEK